MSHILNLNSGSLPDNLLGRGNYGNNLSQGPLVDPLNDEDTAVNFPTILRRFGGRKCN